MVFTINPAEAQAIQEDEAQLLAAIAQAARGIAATLNGHQSAAAQQSDALRIQMGRRLVYGQMARGEFRNHLNADTLKAIFDAVQRPVAMGTDLSQYQGKVPAIEIRNGEQILFREERDSTVTVNRIRLQLEHSLPIKTASTATVVQSDTQPQVAEAKPAEHSNSSDTSAIQDQDWKADDILQAARYLLNPLGDSQPIYDAVAVQGYHVTREQDNISIARNSVPILVAQNGAITTNQIEQRDWEVFQQLQYRSLSRQSKADFIGFEAKDQDAGIERQAPTQNKEVPVAIAVLERETAKLPEGPTKALLQTTAQNWKYQLQQGVQTGLRQGMSWLVSRPEAIRTQTAARAVLDLFHRGYDRTGEKSYSIGGFRLSLQGVNLYTLSDAQGKLLQFQAFRSPVPGLDQPSIKVLNSSDRLTSGLVKTLRDLQRNPQVMPRGDLDQEALYAAKTSKLENTVREFLQNHVKAQVWDREGGRYRLEVGEGDQLRITDKEGHRGILFQRQDGAVFSKLGAADFAYFDRLAARLQPLSQSSSKSVQLQSRDRSHRAGLEME